MTEKEFLDFVTSGSIIKAGSEAHLAMHRMSQNALRITAEINSAYHTPEGLRALMSELTGKKMDEGFGLFPPFYTDCGRNISIGRRTFLNMGCTFQDWGGITIGDDCLIGHHCTICTINHEKAPDSRGSMAAAPVIIGDKVWIGANVTILPSVTIGDGAIIGAGAVVTKPIPAGCIAAGVPAKVINRI